VIDMFTEAELQYLTEQRVARLATAGPDGTLQNNPVGFGVNTRLGTIDIGGYNLARSRKFRNVADNGRAALVVDDVVSTDPWRVRFLDLRGRAEALTAPQDSAAQADGPIIRFWPSRIISAGLRAEDHEVDAHQMRFQARDVTAG
jgi:pyridoxamine 5'-phosphate oxidase family protein